MCSSDLQGQPPAPPPPPAANGATAPSAAETALAEERARVKGLERELAALRAAHMSDDERKLAEARDAGRAEAREEAARLLAAAEFRHLAAGRMPDPDGALEMIDLAKLVRDGAPNKRAIAALVDKLAPPAPPPPAPPLGRVPAGVIGGTPPEGDFLRAAMGGR